MTLLESLIAVAILTISLPFFANAETNLITSIHDERILADERIILSTASDDLFNGDAVPTTMAEEGITYSISTAVRSSSDGNTEDDEFITVTQASASGAGISREVEIPLFKPGIFTY